MPTITNFGNVVSQGDTTATGNLTIQGTGTSSFSSPLSGVTMAGTLAVTGVTTHSSNIIPNSDLGCGIGTAAQRMANVYSANINVYSFANIFTANIWSSNVTNTATFQNSVYHFQNTFLTDTRSYMSTAGIIVPATTGTAGLGGPSLLFANAFLQTANIGSLTAQMAMNVTGNVYISNSINVTNIFSVTTNASYMNIISGGYANMASINVFTGANITQLTVTTLANISNANISTANIYSANIVYSNIQILNVSGAANTAYLNVGFIANIFNANIITSNIYNANIGSSNILNLNVSTGANITQLTVTTLANIFSSNTVTANIYNSNIGSSNIQNLNVSTGANITQLTVTTLANIFTANIITSNIYSANVVVANVQYLNISYYANLANLSVSQFANIFTANIITSNIYNANIGSSNILNLNVSTGANITQLTVTTFANIFSSNTVTANHQTLNTVFSNILNLNVSTGANITQLTVNTLANIFSSNIVTANIYSANVVVANVQYLNISYYANLANLSVSQFANINTANIVTVFHSNLNVSSNANIFNMNVFTANVQSTLNAMYATMTGNYYGNASGVWNLNISNVNSGTLPFSSTLGLGAAGISINGITGAAGQYITATGTGSGLQWGGPTATIIWAQVPGFVSPPIYYSTANVGMGGPYSTMSWGVGSSTVNQYPGTPLDVYGGLGSFSNLMDATYTGTIRIQNQTPNFAYNGGLEFKTGTSSSGSGHRILTTTDSTGLSPLIFQFRSSTKTWSNAMAINCDAGNLSGYVGIGTMNPLYQLHVYQPSVSATLGGILVQVSQASQQSTYSLQNSASGTCVFYLNGSSPSDGPANSATLRNNAGDLRLAGASQTPLIYLQNSNGSVGINTNNPGTYNLNLYGTTSGTSTTVGALTNSGGSLSLMAGVNAAYIGVAGTYKYYFSGTEFAPQNGTGSVNIGTAGNMFGTIYGQVHTNSDGTNGYVSLQKGNTTLPGYMSINTPSNRVGYVGWGGVTNYIALENENGYLGWNVTGNCIVSNNLGIGTASTPGYRLQVSGLSGISAVAQFYGVATSMYMYLDNDNAANQVAIQFNRAGTMQWINYVAGSSTDIRWYNGGGDRMILNSGGALTITGGLSATTGTFSSGLTSTTGTFSSTLSGKSGTFSNGDNSNLIFGPNSTWGSYLYVGSGNPGNTVSGQARLLSTNGNCHLDAGTGQTMYLQYYNNAAGGGGGIQSWEGWTHNGSLTVTGNVGIGTTNPGYPLDVSGKIRSSQLALVGYTNIVNRRPIWGTGSRAQALYVSLPYSSSLQTSAVIFYTYGPFAYAVPAAGTGSTRYYRIYAVYNDNATTGTFNLVASFNYGGGSVTFTLGNTYGGADVNYNRDAYSATVADPGNGNHASWTLTGVPSSLAPQGGSVPFNVYFDYIELQAIDQY